MLRTRLALVALLGAALVFVASASAAVPTLTGTDGPRLWDRFVSSEVARVSRYRRPVTVALVDVFVLVPTGIGETTHEAT